MNDNHKAISIFEEANNIEGEIPSKEKGIVYQNLGACFVSLNDLEKSKQSYLTAIKHFQSSQSHEEISRCYFYLGVSELREKRNKEALEMFEVSL